MENTENKIHQVSYFLVLLRIGPNHENGSQYWEDHIQFIELMIEENIVLLGGDWESGFDDIEGAYLLHTSSRSEAEQWASRDPLVIHKIYIAHVIEWRLVGINERAVDSRLK